ncbi:MAG: malectin domain-containing carbohydrate-binding protein [Bacteroidota bacterium]
MDTFNGQSLGSQKPEFGETNWEVKFVEGSNNITAVANSGNMTLRDETVIEVHFFNSAQPKSLLHNDKLCINVGQSRTFFTDPLTSDYWIHDMPYREGFFGHINGRYHTVWNDMKAWEGIREGIDAPIKGSKNDPLFQTFLVGIHNYRVDVPQGDYLVELLFTEPFSMEARVNPAEKTGCDKNGERVFSVYVNELLIRQDMNLAKEYGEQQAHIISAEISCHDGIRIHLIPKKGEPVLCGIKIRKL